MTVSLKPFAPRAKAAQPLVPLTIQLPHELHQVLLRTGAPRGLAPEEVLVQLLQFTVDGGLIKPTRQPAKKLSAARPK